VVQYLPVLLCLARYELVRPLNRVAMADAAAPAPAPAAAPAPRASLIRKHALMTLKPGAREAYRASHNEGFWPEMGAMLKAHGAHNYAISLLEEPAGSGGGTLFAYVEIEDEGRWASVKDEPVCKRWWKWMEGECVSPRLACMRMARARARACTCTMRAHAHTHEGP
jgi:L-rhamnose mutarotase